MTKLGFCGLGQMGAPMALRLLRAGHDVVVWNRTPDKAATLVEEGASLASSPADAAAPSEAVVTMLATPAAVEDVVFGEDGVAAGIASGAYLVEMSTIGPEAVHALADRLPERVEVIDAPVLGSVPQAEDGSLRIFVGASDDAFTRLKDVFQAMGESILVGPRGAGAAMKLVANSTLGALVTALAEGLVLADALGLHEHQVLDILGASPIGATVARKRAHIESDTFPPSFKLGLAIKDMRLVADAAASAGIALPVARAALARFEEADAAGLADLDYSAVVAHVRGRPARP